MSDKSKAEGIAMGWRSSGPYYRMGVIVPALNADPKARSEWLKQMKFKTIEDFMEALVKP